MQIVKVLEDLHPLRDLIELAKSVEHDLVGLAAIPVHLRTIEQTLETIAHNTSSEVP